MATSIIYSSVSVLDRFTYILHVLSFLFWPLFSLSFDLRHLITTLICSNNSYQSLLCFVI